MERLKAKISYISDFLGSGIAFKDLTPLIRDLGALSANGRFPAVDDLLAAGGTAKTGCELLKSLNTVIAACGLRC
ncbi:hypothetical protein RP726_06795 [Candidatus Methylospira mobilis]|uniref:hypothetical protein n=1 Tax=Candidatus Methylospira mobilis TaxID=1808979 RepID=UPI0028E67DE0|nr:hypothetical protein [Candidatus Methylospira mobilis]WNV06119.1 hypothetical protein RP726_06795 [Candidatus Methylospira mobilis]